MRESQIKQQMVRDIRKEGGYARRIEDRFSVGMPDTVLIPKECVVVWAEVKIVTGNTLRVSDRQYIELRRLRVAPHSTSFMVGWKEGEFYIAPPNKDGVKLEDCMKQHLAETFSDFIRRAVSHAAI